MVLLWFLKVVLKMQQQCANLYIMKKIIRTVVIASLLIAFGCAENSNEVNTSTESGISLSTKRLNSIDYTEQMPFVVMIDKDIYDDFEDVNDLQSKIDDTSVTWTTFDALYSSSLPDDVRQNLAFIILAKKDFIGYVKQNPTSTNVGKLQKYITDLVDTEYIGFTVLYESLKALQQVSVNHNTYIAQKVDAIELYATDAVFHQDMLDQGVGGGIDQLTYDKIESDLANLANIGSL